MEGEAKVEAETAVEAMVKESWALAAAVKVVGLGGGRAQRGALTVKQSRSFQDQSPSPYPSGVVAVASEEEVVMVGAAAVVVATAEEA